MKIKLVFIPISSPAWTYVIASGFVLYHFVSSSSLPSIISLSIHLNSCGEFSFKERMKQTAAFIPHRWLKRAENEVGKTKSICARIKHLNLSIPVSVTFRWRMNCSQWPQYLHFLPLSVSHVFGQKEFFEIRDKKKF